MYKRQQYERGYISPYMATDMEKMEAVLSDPYILLTDQKVTNIQDLSLIHISVENAPEGSRSGSLPALREGAGCFTPSALRLRLCRR